MRSELFEESNDIVELEDLYDPDERTELEKIKEHYKILLDYVVELENRNEILREKISIIEHKNNKLQKEIDDMIYG